MPRFMPAVLLSLVLALGLLSGGPVVAQENRVLGIGRLFSNDYLGDGHDRWRSGSYQFSLLRGPEWTGALPQDPGLVLEYRWRSDIIAPMRVSAAGVDRPYVGRLSFGVHSHSALGPVDLSAGADLVLLGPQTRLADAQEWFHETFGFSGPHGTDHQIADALRLAATVELAWPVRLTQGVQLRPFAEVQFGVEDQIRLGADLLAGPAGQGGLLVRDATTGHLIRAIEAPGRGLSLVAGADWTQVGETLYLPRDQGFVPVRDRFRARFGVHWQIGPKVSVFYGATWLSEEFVGQDRGDERGQILGSVMLDFTF